MLKGAGRMSNLLLYKHDASPPCCAVMMLGDILGLKFNYKEPDLIALENKEPHMKELNPMGTIPILQDGDFVISESHAINIYLLRKYGAHHSERLYPSDATAQARVHQALFFDTGVMFIRLKVVALPTLLHGMAGPSAKHLSDIEDAYVTLETYLQRHVYVAADHLTLADLSLGSTVTAMQGIHKLDSVRFPRSAEWLKRLEAEPFFKKSNAPGAAMLAQLLKIYWEKNRSSQ